MLRLLCLIFVRQSTCSPAATTASWTGSARGWPPPTAPPTSSRPSGKAGNSLPSCSNCKLIDYSKGHWIWFLKWRISQSTYKVAKCRYWSWIVWEIIIKSTEITNVIHPLLMSFSIVRGALFCAVLRISEGEPGGLLTIIHPVPPSNPVFAVSGKQ